MPDVGQHEAALAGIFCRSGVPHAQPEAFGPPCLTCLALAEFAVVALWEDAIAEGRRRAAAQLRAVIVPGARFYPEWARGRALRAADVAEWAARIAEGNAAT